MVGSVPSPRRRTTSALILLVAAVLGIVHIHGGHRAFMLPLGGSASTSPSSGTGASTGRRNMLSGVVAIGTTAIQGSASAESDGVVATGTTAIQGSTSAVSDGVVATGTTAIQGSVPAVKPDEFKFFDMSTPGPLEQFVKFKDGIPKDVTGYERADGARILVGPLKIPGFVASVEAKKTAAGNGIKEVQVASYSDKEDAFECTSGTMTMHGVDDALPITHWWYRVLKVDGKEAVGVIIQVPMDERRREDARIGFKFDDERPLYDSIVKSLTLV